MKALVGFLVVAPLCLTACESTYRHHDASVLASIEKDPARYVGQLFAFEGRVIHAESSMDGEAFQIMLTDYAGHVTGDSLAVRFAVSESPVTRDHRVRVLGRVMGSISGTNAFGGAVQAVALDAIAVWDKTAGRVVWIPKEEALVNRWRSGSLFSGSPR